MVCVQPFSHTCIYSHNTVRMGSGRCRWDGMGRWSGVGRQVVALDGVFVGGMGWAGCGFGWYWASGGVIVGGMSGWG